MKTSLILVALLFPASTTLLAQQTTQSTNAAERSTFMFVQTAASGTFVPSPNQPGHYTLTLEDVSPQTVYFSDRPLRIAGQAPTETFLHGLHFGNANPPNAAVEVTYAPDDADVIVVELRNPDYNPRKGTLQYDVTVLNNTTKGLAFYSERRDAKLPEKFGSVALFIDDCPDAYVECERYGVAGGYCGTLPGGKVGTCWHWSTFECQFCRSGYDDQCNAMFSNCCHEHGSKCGAIGNWAGAQAMRK